MLVFVDTETTGLDPTVGSLLEVGMVATLDNLTVIADHSVVIAAPLAHARMSDDVRKMHERSGLLADVRTQGVDIASARDGVTAFLTGLGQETGSIPMCGSTVHFDRTWLRHFMPSVERWFHYRNIDVSTLKELVRRWKPAALRDDKSSAKHRALDDLRATLSELKHYREHFLNI